MSENGEPLRSLRRRIDLANAIAGIQVAQQQRIIGQNVRLEQLVREGQHEERLFRFRMWMEQTVDGSAYKDWANVAQPLIELIRLRDHQWTEVWRREVATRISPAERACVLAGRYVEPPLPIKIRRKHWLWMSALSVFLLIGAINAIDNGPVPLFVVLATLFVGLTATLVWSFRYQSPSHAAAEAEAEHTLRARRVQHFGVDPLADDCFVPGWSADGRHGVYADLLQGYMDAALTSFPSRQTLPELAIPEFAQRDCIALPAHRALLDAWVAQR